MSKKTNKIARLFKKQHGICWICAHPMLPAAINQLPGPFNATLDHLAPRQHPRGVADPRPVKAAHAVCNHKRHHNPSVHPLLLEELSRFFSDPNWKEKAGDYWFCKRGFYRKMQSASYVTAKTNFEKRSDADHSKDQLHASP